MKLDSRGSGWKLKENGSVEVQVGSFGKQETASGKQVSSKLQETGNGSVGSLGGTGCMEVKLEALGNGKQHRENRSVGSIGETENESVGNFEETGQVRGFGGDGLVG